MAIEKKEKGSGNGLSFLLSGVFFILVIWFCVMLKDRSAYLQNLNHITFWEFAILTLAAFRLTRLLVYDKVAQWIRDLFLDTREVTENGVIYVHRNKPAKGIRRLLADLLGCPWCVGVWISVFTVFIYFMWPVTWYFWLLLAVAGTSSFIQLTANMIGWKAELGKLSAKKME